MRNFDAGAKPHCLVGLVHWQPWGLRLLVLAVHWLLVWFDRAGLLLRCGMLLILYATLGFRQFSHHFTRHPRCFTGRRRGRCACRAGPLEAHGRQRTARAVKLSGM